MELVGRAAEPTDSGAQPGGERVGEKVGEKVGENLTDNQTAIVRLLDQNPRISAAKLSVQIGISQRKTEENMAKLRKLGVIRRVGPAKGGYWEVLR